ncbi:MAG: hypothetical protein AB7G15_00925 [Alphaproteobacteria bacterium]
MGYRLRSLIECRVSKNAGAGAPAAAASMQTDRARPQHWLRICGSTGSKLL